MKKFERNQWLVGASILAIALAVPYSAGLVVSSLAWAQTEEESEAGEASDTTDSSEASETSQTGEGGESGETPCKAPVAQVTAAGGVARRLSANQRHLAGLACSRQVQNRRTSWSRRTGALRPRYSAMLW